MSMLTEEDVLIEAEEDGNIIKLTKTQAYNIIEKVIKEVTKAALNKNLPNTNKLREDLKKQFGIIQ
jgi:hypothetical protein